MARPYLCRSSLEPVSQPLHHHRMKITYLLLLVMAVGCAQKSITSSQVQPGPTHPCFTAAGKGDVDYIKNNIETCKSLHNQYGTTPLMLASAKGHEDVINTLVQSGTDVNAQDGDNSTAINYAAVTNQVGAATLLVLSGADLESKRPDGISVLMTAVQTGSPQMIRVLTSTHQAINAVNEDGWTPLYFAIRRQDPGLLDYLLHQGACKNTVDKEKISPVAFAKEVGWKEGIQILNSAPACGKTASP